VAVLLTSVGFYGVMSYLVLERKQEIAVRMALGAQPRSIFWLLAAPSFRLLLLGTAVGLLAAACTSPLLIPLLYDVAPFDPGTVLYVLAFLVMATLLATYIPIRRATRADLIVALGHN
jgi:putative ABC transport system permease protein